MAVFLCTRKRKRAPLSLCPACTHAEHAARTSRQQVCVCVCVCVSVTKGHFFRTDLRLCAAHQLSVDDWLCEWIKEMSPSFDLVAFALIVPCKSMKCHWNMTNLCECVCVCVCVCERALMHTHNNVCWLLDDAHPALSHLYSLWLSVFLVPKGLTCTIRIQCCLLYKYAASSQKLKDISKLKYHNMFRSVSIKWHLLLLVHPYSIYSHLEVVMVRFIKVVPEIKVTFTVFSWRITNNMKFSTLGINVRSLGNRWEAARSHQTLKACPLTGASRFKVYGVV